MLYLVGNTDMSEVKCNGVIVVVDDEEDIRELLRRVLEKRGYKVATAEDGVAALELMHATPTICFVITDISMPRKDGLALLADMASSPALANLPICVSTSAPHLAPSGVTLLPKPVDLGKLLALIETHTCHN